MRAKLIPLSIGSCLLFCALSPTPTAHAEWLGEYFPVTLGSNWTYQNQDFPGDSFTDSVFELIEYEGHSAVRYGIGIDDHSIVQSDGRTVWVYAEIEDGVLADFVEDFQFGEFEDGSFFEICPAAVCDSSLIRVWDELDPVLRGIYQIDPGLTDLVLMASYDSSYPPNLNNLVVESNLPPGVDPPAGAVTGLEWYRRGVGLQVLRDVDAASGGLESNYVLVDHVIGTHEQSSRPNLVLEQNTPNPFNPRTIIGYSLSEPMSVSLLIYDGGGRLIRQLMSNEMKSEGPHQIAWDGRDDAGRLVASGFYGYRLQSKGFSQTRKMVLIK